VATLSTRITNKQADEEFERPQRNHRFVQGLLDGSSHPQDFEQIAGYFKSMFTQGAFIEA
jgi:hypothetical protein